MRAYSIYGVVGREATVRAAAGPAGAKLVAKLRFGLAFLPLPERASEGGGRGSATTGDAEARRSRATWEPAAEASERHEDELVAHIAGPGGDTGAPPFIELMRLTPAVIDWLQRASARGPLAYLEAEFADGAGFHAAAAFRDGRLFWGPRHVEDREPVNAVLRRLGVVADPGKDELDSVGLLDEPS